MAGHQTTERSHQGAYKGLEMKTYKFGDHKAWLNKHKTHADVWQAFTQRQLGSRAKPLYVFEYRDGKLLSITDCSQWRFETHKGGVGGHVRALKQLIADTHYKDNKNVS